MNRHVRFACFLIPFAICVGVSIVLWPLVGCGVAGAGFTIAYCYGEGK